MYLYIHVYLNVPGICLKPPRSFRQSSFGSLFALARTRSFFLLFFHTRELFHVFLPSVFHRYKRTKPLSKSEPTTKSLRYTSLVFSLSLSLVLMRLYFFFVFVFFCFVTSQIFLWLSVLFFLIFTHARNTLTRTRHHTNKEEKRIQWSRLPKVRILSRLSLSHSLSFLFFFERRRPSFSSLLVVVSSEERSFRRDRSRSFVF